MSGRPTSTAMCLYAIAVKQLYASHYFETALDLTVCVRDQEHPEHPGIYLITLKGSQQAGLTGLKGVIVIFAFSILSAYLIDPVVRFLQRHSLFFKNLRGPHVVEAYLTFIVLLALV